MNDIVNLVHISDIKKGDTVLHDGHLRTVCNSNIHNDPFMGTSIFGDSYHSGYRKVVRVNMIGGGSRLKALYSLWELLGNVDFDEDDNSLEKFLHFPSGTDKFEIWHWFESTDENFIIGEIMDGIYR